MTWFEHARDPSVVVRAAKTSALVGVLLVAINQGDLIVTAGFAALSVPKLVLTFFVPYAVSTNSSVASRMEAQEAQEARTAAGGAPR